MVEQTDVQTPQLAAPSQNVHVVVHDSCLYPSPPKKIEIVLPRTATEETLISKIADECGYSKDVFEVKFAKIVIEADGQRTLGELGATSKMIVSSSKRQGKV